MPKQPKRYPPLSTQVTIDDVNDIATICGTRFAGMVFRNIGMFFPIGTTFRLLERNEDGVVTVKRVVLDGERRGKGKSRGSNPGPKTGDGTSSQVPK